MKEAEGRKSSKHKGDVVKWKFVETKSLGAMIGMGFPMAEGYYSIGYNNEDKPVEARRLKPEGDEITVFLAHDTEAIKKMWDEQLKR